MFGAFKLPHLRRRSEDSDGHYDQSSESPKNKRHLPMRKRNSDSEAACPSISSLRPGSVALASDQLTPGDRIHSINGISTSRMRPEEVSNLLENVDGNALLEIEYCLPSYASQSSLCVASKVTEVHVERIDGSLGITLRGGCVPDHPHLSRPLIITQVRPQGPAYATGLLRVGDRLLQVDGTSLTSKTLLEAQRILKESSTLPTSALTVEYDVSIMESVRYATGPLLVEIDRHANEDLGLLLTHTACDDLLAGGDGVYVEHIIPASTADRCGALGIGDQLLAVDDVCLDEWRGSLQEAMGLLKSATRIQIMPLHALQRCFARGGYNMGPYGGSPTVSGFSTLNSKRSRATRTNTRANRHSSISKSIEDPASSYCGYATSLGVCHSETLSVTLVADRGKGYGLSVTVAEHHDDAHPGDIVVARVSADSPAFRCGCLQSGDRIVAVNHRTNLTLQEVNAILEMGVEPSVGCNASSGKLTLQVDFDVADTIVPSSGIFTVKLARRGGPGLGITITASKSHPEEPFIVSEIRRGSVAHRTGTLHAGDRLLAIDNRPLDHLTVETAFDILQSAPSEIVTLKVEKSDSSNLLHDSVVYTVELLRLGGPLGITIAGSEDCSEAIVLSKLTEGGLAEKTGALHVGDRLVAINGEPLEQKPLSEAIRLLQTAGDRVQLKIARNLTTPSPEEARCNYSSPGLTSIDSAVHSWGSNPPEESVESIFDAQLAKDFESVLSEPLSYQEEHVLPTPAARDSFNGSGLRKRDSQLQFYSDTEDFFCPSPLPLPNFDLGLKYDHYSQQSFPSERRADSEVYHITLYKDAVYDDYGFSVSDGLYEKGVYINRIRKGGPADIVGLLRPYDRIVQVNDTKTRDFDCCLTVPLIASAGDRIDLMITRNPFMMLHPGMDSLSRKSFAASSNTITKTL